jgi:hypothetical protein
MMDLTLPAPMRRSVPKRLGLFVGAVSLGTLVGIGWGTSAGPDLAYWGFLGIFLNPRAQVASLGFGLALGFLAGAIHFVRV